MVPWLAAAIPIAINAIGGLFGAKRQQNANERLARYQHNKNMELLKYQLDFNSPESQMQRFKDARLNPNLMYSQGSAGNMEQAPRYPEIQSADYQTPLSGLGTQYQQLSLSQAQAQLTNQKVNESGIKQDLMRAQTNLTNANPHLNKQYVDAMVINLESVAKIKEQEADFKLSKTQDDVTGARWQRGYLIMQRSLDMLTQKYKLGEVDQQIKGQILQGKDWENDLKQIQSEWMKNGDITPQHIYQGILLLLSKMM